MAQRKTIKVGESGALVIYPEEDDDGYDCTTPPIVIIEMQVKNDDLSVSYTGSLDGEQAILHLISALNEASEQARATAKEWGYYEWRDAVDKEGKDENGFPPSWRVGQDDD
jgi:hypothetical protein